jgi:hypothetical protein
VLGLRKRDLVEAIAAQPRQSRGRAMGYSALQTELRRAWQASRQRQAWERRLEAVRAKDAEDAVEFDRELFYAIQPRARLEGVIAGVRQAFEVG